MINPRMWKILMGVVMIGIWATALTGCKDDGSGFGLDDGTGPEGETQSMCETYPTETNAFSVGAVPRNYDMWDMDDNEVKLCDFAKGNAKLMFLAITDES